jgi:hypothetical protein
VSLLLNALLNAFSRHHSLVVCYDKEVCCMWGGRLRAREGCVWGGYCVGEGKGEMRGGVRLMGGHVIVLQGGTSLRECSLVNGWYQER